MKLHSSSLARALVLALVGGALMACVGCSRESGSNAGAGDTQSQPKPGDRVVVEVARAEFIEGIVEGGDKQKLTVRVHGTDKTRDVDAANAYRTGAPAAVLEPGAYAICEVDAHQWRACRVVEKGADGLKVGDENGAEKSLAIAHVLKPSEVTKLNLQHAFERGHHRKAFAEGADKAGGPRRPSGWKPSAGDRVVVRSGGAFVSATVKEPRPDLVLVVLTSGDGSVQALAHDDVWPEPPASGAPTVGDYAYVRPRPGERAWRLVRVEATVTGKAMVAGADGEQTSVDVKDVLPFTPR